MLATWLTLDNTGDRTLDDLIRDLAQRYSAPVFRPHITVLGGIDLTPSRLAGLTDAVFKTVAPFRVQPVALCQTTDIWRTVIIELAPSEELVQINRHLLQLARPPVSKPFAPHISLLYKKLRPEIRARIVSRITIDAEYRVVGAALVDISGPVENWQIRKQYLFD